MTLDAGGGRKFQGFRGGWNKWEAQDGTNWSDVGRSFKDRPDLHFHDFWNHDAQANTAQSHHWIAFMELLNMA